VEGPGLRINVIVNALTCVVAYDDSDVLLDSIITVAGIDIRLSKWIVTRKLKWSAQYVGIIR